jgi:hypothetical protein
MRRLSSLPIRSRASWYDTPPAQRRHLVIVEHRDDTHLLEPLEWEGDQLVPAPRRRVDVELRTT